EVEAGDIPEELAGKRLAAAVVGEGVEVKAYSEGKWSLIASRRGLFRVRTDRLRGVNALDGICVYTLYDGLPVEAGEVVARCKITPLVIAGSTIETIERLAAEAKGLLTVDAFQSLSIGAGAREGLGEKRGAGPPGEPALDRDLAWARRGRDAVVRHVLGGDDLRPRPPARPGRRARRQPRTGRAGPRRPAFPRLGVPVPGLPRKRQARGARVGVAAPPGLYTSVIRDRWRKPRFPGHLPGPHETAEDANPACGDRLRPPPRPAA